MFVLGMSMGGLVARYALRDMETNGLGLNHDTRLYISHDAPHQGANVPLGFQAMVRQLSGYSIGIGIPPLYYNISLSSLIPELESGMRILQAPATRQLLKYQLSGTGNIISDDNSMHETFMTEYQALGYPQNTQKNIAIASGSECGTQQQIAPYGEFLRVDEEAGFRYLANLSLSALGMFTSSPLISIGGFLTTSSDLKVTFVVNALPDRASQRIYKGKLQIKRKIAWLIPYSVTLFDRAFNSSPYMLALESSPGGIYDIANFGGAPADLGLDSSVFRDNVELVFQQTQFNFIPIHSSLDIGSGAQPITNADLAKVYSPLSPPVGIKNVPFDNFFTNPVDNEEHIDFTLENGDWLLDELRNNQAFYSCAAQCILLEDLILDGPPTICYDETEIYNLNNTNTAANINWITSPTLSIEGGQGSTSLTVRGSSSDEQAWIEAVITDDCGGTITSERKTIQIGRPLVISAISFSSGQAVCPSNGQYNHGTYSFSVNTTLQNGETSEWTIFNGQIVSGQFNTSTVTVYLNDPLNIGFFGLDYKKFNDCAQSGTSQTFQYNSGGFSFSVHPNPATEEVIIHSSNKKISMADKSLRVKVYDNTYNLVIDRQIVSGIGLKINQLPSGLYVVHIVSETGTEVHRLVVE